MEAVKRAFLDTHAAVFLYEGRTAKGVVANGESLDQLFENMFGELSQEDRERLKALERENRELKRANEILRKASAFFAQAELDRGRK